MSQSNASNSRTLPFIILSVALVISLATGLYIIKGKGNNDASREQLAALNFYLFSQARILSGVPLDNLNGDSQPFAEHGSGWRLVNFGYMFCPDVCPINLALLNDVKTALDKELDQIEPLQVMHITFDPVRDTPNVLSAYLEYMNPSFYGLTGELENIRRITQQFNMVFIHEEPNDQGHYFITHSDSMALVNPDGQYIGLFKGPYQKDNMIQALKILMGKS